VVRCAVCGARVLDFSHLTGCRRAGDGACQQDQCCELTESPHDGSFSTNFSQVRFRHAVLRQRRQCDSRRQACYPSIFQSAWQSHHGICVDLEILVFAVLANGRVDEILYESTVSASQRRTALVPVSFGNELYRVMPAGKPSEMVDRATS